MLWLAFMDFHEGTAEVINYLDKPLASYIREIQNEDTTIMLMSDHGFHMGGLKMALGGHQHSTELRLPAMFLYNLKGLNKEEEYNLKYN